ncbi:2-hydroxyacid dehydrogenase [Micromonospora yasonensis]|uniref:2-hydroxyacid dehydrogenase n=1 Tax=Micromonospora yasonensis TaxID=1128667 RepID=UPI00223221C3|nr:2-hydroxyacid dehydrogenase [Micromonospora yasonensis]MCW3838972.1 2-hydroxyacid dehydrogenase [Micromonospora yasonensis]
MTVLLLAAGDHFVLNHLLVDAVHAELPDGIDIRQLTLPWPVEPFGPVGEVDEASGSEDDLIEALHGVQICVTQMAPLTRRVLHAAHDLKLVCVTRGGPVNVNIEAATERKIAVCSAPGRNAAATAEHTVAMILAVIRRIASTHMDLTGGLWRGDYYRYDSVGPELSGSILGLVGFGAVGSRVAQLLRGFGARILVHDPYVNQQQLGDVAELTTLEDLLSRSNIVSLHARVTPQTTRMIGAVQLALMPPGSVIVNCARGALLDYDAVCDALDSRHLFGAAFDVFPQEPIPAGSRLLTTHNIVMTPHLAGASKHTAANAARIAAGEVGRYLRGEPLCFCVNPEALD